MAATAPRAAEPESRSPFAFLSPTLTVTPRDMQLLRRGDTIVRMLPDEPSEAAVFVAVGITADGARLKAWVRDVANLKRGDRLAAVGRFSDQPTPSDVQALTLDDYDLSTIRRCRPGSCKLKLSAAEMASLQATADAAGPAWPSALQDAFRGMIVTRVARYLADGHAALGPWADRDTPAAPRDLFSELLRHVSFLETRLPGLERYLRDYPRAPASGIDSFVYWSVDRLGNRPSVTATHVAIASSSVPGEPEVLAAGKQLFATRYVGASLTIVGVTRGTARSERYLFYVARSRIDVLDKWYGGLARTVLNNRVESEAADVIRGLKESLESR